MKDSKQNYIDLCNLKQDQSIWLYIAEPMGECFPIVEKEYKIAPPGFDGNWTHVKSVDSGKIEARIINRFDTGVSAHSGNKIYIWLSEKNLKRAFEIVKDYHMDKLVKATNEVSKLCTIFDHMEGWIDFFSEEER